jgi:hypothetical protein
MANPERVARLEELLRFTDRHIEILQLQLQFEKESHEGLESVLKIASIEQRLERVRARRDEFARLLEEAKRM